MKQSGTLQAPQKNGLQVHSTTIQPMTPTGVYMKGTKHLEHTGTPTNTNGQVAVSIIQSMRMKPLTKT